MNLHVYYYVTSTLKPFYSVYLVLDDNINTETDTTTLLILSSRLYQNRHSTQQRKIISFINHNIFYLV